MGSLGTAGAALTATETEVFSGNAPTAWTDLDLSGTVGANAALVLIKLQNTTATDMRAVAFRKNGDTDEFWGPGQDDSASGCALVNILMTFHLVLLVATDNAGKIEWKAEIGAAATIDIIAYIK